MPRYVDTIINMPREFRRNFERNPTEFRAQPDRNSSVWTGRHCFVFKTRRDARRCPWHGHLRRQMGEVSALLTPTALGGFGEQRDWRVDYAQCESPWGRQQFPAFISGSYAIAQHSFERLS